MSRVLQGKGLLVPGAHQRLFFGQTKLSAKLGRDGVDLRARRELELVLLQDWGTARVAEANNNLLIADDLHLLRLRRGVGSVRAALVRTEECRRAPRTSAPCSKRSPPSEAAFTQDWPVLPLLTLSFTVNYPTVATRSAT